jgi:hypothetical protein
MPFHELHEYVAEARLAIRVGELLGETPVTCQRTPSACRRPESTALPIRVKGASQYRGQVPAGRRSTRSRRRGRQPRRRRDRPCVPIAEICTDVLTICASVATDVTPAFRIEDPSATKLCSNAGKQGVESAERGSRLVRAHAGDRGELGDHLGEGSEVIRLHTQLVTQSANGSTSPRRRPGVPAPSRRTGRASSR